MIKYFTVENYYSVKNESVLEFDLNLQKETSLVAQPVIGFAGANASGKSTILKALTFTLWFASESFLGLQPQVVIPVVPFITNQENPCKFHIIFTIEGIDYEYVLEVTTQKVISEEFYYYPNKEQKPIYKRDGQKVKFGKGINKIETKDLRENSSIISFAAQFETQKTTSIIQNYYNQFDTNLSLPFRKILLDIYGYLSSNKLKSKSIEFLKLADVGIDDFELEKSNEIIFKIMKLASENPELINSILSNNLNNPQIEQMKNEETLSSLTEKMTVNFPDFFDPIFIHRIDNKNIKLSKENQSVGTLQGLELFGRILQAIEKGSLLIVDELETHIHQNLVAYMIGLFQNPEVNTKNAQLIFSFHNTAFMEILSPEQLWFAEKNDQGHSDFYCAANVTGIPDLYKKNLETLYRIGRFGAKPKLL